MTSLLDCPAEVRQQTLDHCLPGDVHNVGVAPRTAPLLPLLLTCKAVRLDVLEILKTWSPVYHIEDPAAIITPRRNRRLDDEEPHMRRISLRLFAGLDLARMRSPPVWAVETVFDVDPWLRCVPSLPRAAVESVTVDLTPVPAWMAARRPDWVRATVRDARNNMFLRGCSGDIRRLVETLHGFYGAAGARVQLGGAVARKARATVEHMMAGGLAAGVFAGEWLAGQREVPTRLSLGLVCRCWGVEVAGPKPRPRSYDQRTIQICNEAHKDGLEKPDLDLGPVSPVSWSKDACTAYYINAQEDENRTRGDLVRLLAFAVEMRTEGVPPDAAIDFAPTIRARRFLLHSLARDLGLASVSVGDAGEKFVRVSRAPEAAAADERESPESGGGGVVVEEDLHVVGQEDPHVNGQEDPHADGEEDPHADGEEEHPTLSSSRMAKPRRPRRSCCAWVPVERLFSAAGDR